MPTNDVLRGNTNHLMVLNVTLSPSSVAANTTAEQTFTVPNLRSTMYIGINKPTAQAGLGIVGVRCSANDTLAITFSNNTGSPIVPTASEIYKLLVISVFQPVPSVF